MTTTSRHRTNIATLFDVFCEIAGVSSNSQNGESAEPLILQKYPEDFNDESILKSIRQFVFPLGTTPEDPSDTAVQLFSFVLTDNNSQLTFGYCRYTPRTNTCICLLSGYAWTTAFSKLLNHISIVMNNGTQDDVDLLLTRIYHTDAPSAGEHLRLESLNGQHTVDIEVPDMSLLPTLKDDKFMLEFYNAVTPRQMISIYASLLRERRIIFTGRKLGQLSACVYAAATLLYPMAWQSLFIPVLPRSLLDMIMAPMPFIIGVPKQIYDSKTIKEIGDVMVVDLDERTLLAAHDDFNALPSEAQSILKSGLKAGIDMGDSLSRVFLRANLVLFGGYRQGLRRDETTQLVSWDKDRFLSEQKPSLQAYLSSLLGVEGVQYLERFIDERLIALNSGSPIKDEFEREANNQETKKGAVRDNATDVIGALKDRVRSIEIRDRIGRLTPKDMRRTRSNGSRSRSVKRVVAATGFEPLSFENIQWKNEEDTRSSSSSEETQSIISPSIGDLIDLGDTPTHPHPPSIPSHNGHTDDFSDLIHAPSTLAPLIRSSPMQSVGHSPLLVNHNTEPIGHNTVPMRNSPVPVQSMSQYTTPVRNSPVPIQSNTMPMRNSPVPAYQNNASMAQNTVPIGYDTAPMRNSPIPIQHKTVAIPPSVVPPVSTNPFVSMPSSTIHSNPFYNMIPSTNHQTSSSVFPPPVVAPRPPPATSSWERFE